MKKKIIILSLILLFTGVCMGPSALAQDAPQDYFLTCDPDSMAFIYENYEENHYIPCTLTIDGQTWPSCRVRIRGDSSRTFPKKSLKVKTDGALFPNGNDVYNFNAEWYDGSYMRVIMATRLFNRAGVPCFKAEHARLHLNGGYFGLYLNIQNMDEVFLSENGIDPLGNLYKASVDGASLTLFEDIYTRWEKKSNESAPWTDLEDLIDDLATVPDGQFTSWALENTDMAELTTIFACNALLGSGSTYYHNYYMYHDINGNGKWSMFPWDVDKTFSAYGLEYKYHRTSFDGWRDNPLPERWFFDPSTFSAFSQEVHNLIEGTFNADFYYPLMDSLQTVIEESVLADTTDNVADEADWLSRIAHEKAVGIEGRIEQISLQLSDSPRSFKVQPVPYALQDSIPLHWSPAVDPNGEQVFYTVRHSTDDGFPDEETQTYTGITDTTFTLPELLPEDRYFWQVLATDDHGSPEMKGYDSYNFFQIRNGTVLPTVIHRDRTLTVVDSPYFINEDMVINEGSVLRIEVQSVVHIAEGCRIIVHGSLEIEGSVHSPVQILPMLGQDRWGAICLDHAGAASSFRNAIIRGASRGPEPWQRGAISSYRTDLLLENVTFDDCLQSVYVERAAATLLDCSFLPTNLEETLMVQIGRARVENCTFWKTGQTGDALDFDALDWGLINGCRFIADGGGDDLIDLGSYCDSLTISNNLIVGAVDKGISMGEGSEALLTGNVIVDCHLGVAVKDNSFCQSIGNTFYGNDITFSLYEKTAGMGGGRAEIINTILAENQTEAILLDELSEAVVSFSLCDSELLPGNENIFADPLFADALESDWNLLPGSPCIDSGDPNGALDPDGTRADMGALFYNQAPAMLVINEINYHPSSTFDTQDWAEIFNPTDVAIDLSGWKFKDDSHSFIFPAGSLIAPQGYLVVAENRAAFWAFFPDVSPVVGDLDFGFSGGGELLTLTDPANIVYDSVHYDDSAPWPVEPDGTGPTLELIHHTLDNSLAASWASSVNHGTPGAMNSSVAPASAPPLPSTFSMAAFPNPFNPQCELSFSLEKTSRVELSIYDLHGRKLVTLLSDQQAPGLHRVTWDGRDEKGQQLASSIYFARLNIDTDTRVIKLTLVK